MKLHWQVSNHHDIVLTSVKLLWYCIDKCQTTMILYWQVSNYNDIPLTSVKPPWYCIASVKPPWYSIVKCQTTMILNWCQTTMKLHWQVTNHHDIDLFTIPRRQVFLRWSPYFMYVSREGSCESGLPVPVLLDNAISTKMSCADLYIMFFRGILILQMIKGMWFLLLWSIAMFKQNCSKDIKLSITHWTISQAIASWISNLTIEG